MKPSNTVNKLSLFLLALAVLSGCASVPKDMRIFYFYVGIGFFALIIFILIFVLTNKKSVDKNSSEEKKDLVCHNRDNDLVGSISQLPYGRHRSSFGPLRPIFIKGDFPTAFHHEGDTYFYRVFSTPEETSDFLDQLKKDGYSISKGNDFILAENYRYKWFCIKNEGKDDLEYKDKYICYIAWDR